MLPKVLVALAFAIAAGACSSPAGNTPAGDAAAGDAPAVDTATEDAGTGDTGCQLTLSGAVNKTIDCLVSATHEGTDLSTVAVGSPKKVEGVPEAVFILLIRGPIVAMTYGWADSLNQTVSVSQTGTVVPNAVSPI